MSSVRHKSFVAFLLTSSLWAGPRPDWDHVRDQVRQTLYIPETPPKLEEKVYGKFSPAEGVVADRVSFGTAYGLRVPAIVYHGSGATIEKHPALIVVNGHRGDKSSWYASYTGILYARAGAVVLTYDPIGEFERNKEQRSETSQHDDLVPPDSMARRMAGLMITDIMQGTRYLAGRTDVDPKRIAVLGFSMGSFVGSLTCAVDTSLRACLLVGGATLDGPGGHWDSSPKKMCQAIPYQSLTFLGDRAAMLFALNARRGPTLVFNGTADKVADIPNHGAEFFADLRRRTVALLGSQKDVFDFEFQADGGHSPYYLSKPAALWLWEKLKFPNWTKKQIQALPETQAHDMTLIGSDIPAVKREDLLAVPAAVWEFQKNNFVYESWVERAREADSAH